MSKHMQFLHNAHYDQQLAGKCVFKFVANTNKTNLVQNPVAKYENGCLFIFCCSKIQKNTTVVPLIHKLCDLWQNLVSSIFVMASGGLYYFYFLSCCSAFGVDHLIDLRSGTKPSFLWKNLICSEIWTADLPLHILLCWPLDHGFALNLVSSMKLQNLKLDSAFKGINKWRNARRRSGWSMFT